MNRGQMEKLAVRLYMLAMKNKIAKSDKENALAWVNIHVRRWNDPYLVQFIQEQVDNLEVM